MLRDLETLNLGVCGLNPKKKEEEPLTLNPKPETPPLSLAKQRVGGKQVVLPRARENPRKVRLRVLGATNRL